jgi:hypothetical protein
MKGLEGSRSIDPVKLLGYDVDVIACYQRCVEELLSPVLPEIRNTDGEKLVFTKSRYAFRPEDRDHIIAKLRSMRNIEGGEEEGERTEFGWTVKSKKHPMMETITRARIIVGPAHIDTECNSRTRNRRLKDRLLKNLGHWIEYKLTSHQAFDAERLRDTETPEGSAALDLDALPEDEREEFLRVVEGMLMGWADQSIPALGGKSPREAVKTEAGREEVVQLINEWENTELRNPNPQVRWDFNKLRRELGLEVQ